ncbi:hypothetical protein [Halobellus sp. H-GB7]|uniref:DUF7524 family protein n=1 Tax=Halobellus sp. H-GB7 TaxID=3069756 RepID=UPI0027B4FC21|nr:hypothetical protein [Halobellus sp. H-GB7]MDQ2053565.1 hypothetical protein [Halobellus sp. H-GB7]
MSESLQVELNGETVHAIDAPDAHTVSGPFHIYLRNAGGPVHVHIHLDDALSEVARIDAVNHYVEGEETIRIPVGVAADREQVSGRLKIVSGYGAEMEYVNVVVEANSSGGSSGRRSPSSQRSPSSDDSARRSVESAEARTPQDPEASAASSGADDAASTTGAASTADTGTAERRTDGVSGGSTTDARASQSTTNTTTDTGNGASGGGGNRKATGSATTGGRRQSNRSEWEQRARAAADEAQRLVLEADVAPREGLAFGALTVVALVVGLGVITTVGEALLTLVILVILAAVVATAGWLLFQ